MLQVTKVRVYKTVDMREWCNELHKVIVYEIANVIYKRIKATNNR